jgi:hypothetical protein
MPHGDFSDYSALFCVGAGLTALFRPSIFVAPLGPIQPMFDGELTANLTNAIVLIGALLLTMGFTLYITRWNTLNGKSAGFGAMVVALTCSSIGFGMDEGTAFVFRGWYIFAAVAFCAGVSACCHHSSRARMHGLSLSRPPRASPCFSLLFVRLLDAFCASSHTTRCAPRARTYDSSI